MIIIALVPTRMLLEEVSLYQVPFWLQVHNLKPGFMSEKVGKIIRGWLGAFLKYDQSNNSLSWRKYMRIRVFIDVRIPLKRYCEMKCLGEEAKQATFKYERLVVFCYVCGFLGHTKECCDKLFALEVDGEQRGVGSGP